MSSGKTYRRVADLIVFGVELGDGSTRGVRDVVLVGHDGERRWAWNGKASARGSAVSSRRRPSPHRGP